MRSRVNAYIAAFLITLAGAGAVLLILRLNEANNFNRSTGYNAASYEPLKNTILQQ